jgi:predicted PurR-regulated permease PerM
LCDDRGQPGDTSFPWALVNPNPIAILLAFLLWGYLWGVPGTLLAVPILATFKIFCDRIEPLKRIGSFLGRP